MTAHRLPLLPLILLAFWGPAACVKSKARSVPDAATVTPNAATVTPDACTPAMAMPFTTSSGLNVVIARFDASDGSKASRGFGEAVAKALSQEIPEYVKSAAQDPAAIKGGFRPVAHVQYAPCVFTSHEDARRLGKAWNASLVVWGRAAAAAGQVPEVHTNDVYNLKDTPLRADNGGTIHVGPEIHLNLPQGGTFRTSVTAVMGGETRDEKGMRSPSQQALLDLDFANLVSERPISLMKFMLGQTAMLEDRFATAIHYFEQTKENAFAGAEIEPYIDAMIGLCYTATGQLEKAAAAVQEGEKACPAGDGHCQSHLQTVRGLTQLADGAIQQALESFAQVLLLSRQGNAQKDDSLQARTLENLGYVNYSLGKIPQALEFFQQQLSLSQKLGDVDQQAQSLINMGTVYLSQGNWKDAGRCGRQALTLLNPSGKWAGKNGFTLIGLGTLYRGLGQWNQALSLYQQALEFFTHSGKLVGEVNVRTHLCWLYNDFGEPQKALVFCNQALEIYKKTGITKNESSIRNVMGLVYSQLGDRQKALELHNQALTLSRQSHGLVEEGISLLNLGGVYKDLGDSPKSRQFYDQARQQFKKAGSAYWEYVVDAAMKASSPPPSAAPPAPAAAAQPGSDLAVCTKMCQSIPNCWSHRSSTCIADCLQNPQGISCLRGIDPKDCSALGQCGVMFACNGMRAAGESTCAQVHACQIDAGGNPFLVCQCMSQLEPARASYLIAFNACAIYQCQLNGFCISTQCKKELADCQRN